MSATDASADGQRPKRLRFMHDANRDSRNRLKLRADWYDEDSVGLELGYGNGNSDPVWVIGIEVQRPPRVLRWLADRQWDRERKAAHG